MPAGRCSIVLALRIVPFQAGVKRLFLGRAIRTDGASNELLRKRSAIPMFASDALSSNAYATQEFLIVLALGGAGLFVYGPWVALAVIVVFLIVIAAYRQNVRAYPQGGGDYVVVSRNLGPRWGMVVASALIIDYVLTVAVAVSAAVANLGSIAPAIGENSVLVAVVIIVLITLFNLRGKGSSRWFTAFPMYLFLFVVFALIGVGVVRFLLGQSMVAESADWVILPEAEVAGVALVFLVIRSFATGTTALTGIQTLGNAVPDFQEPKARNAAAALGALAGVSMTMFAGITWLALTTGVQMTAANANLIGLPQGQQQKTILVQIAGAVFDNAMVAIILVGLATFLILLLAANSAYQGFPQLGSLLARDGYLPRQLHTRGDRLAYSNGIIILGAFAVGLVIAFQASVTSLIQLYIVGVFLALSLSQLAMVRHWSRERASGIDQRKVQRARLINLLGFLCTSLVLVIVLAAKFLQGAWLVVVALPLVFLIMRGVHAHYDRIGRALAAPEGKSSVLPTRVHALVLVSKMHKPTLRALAFARATRPTVLEAVTVQVDVEETQRLQREWISREIPVTLRILESPYREITRPIIDYVSALRTDNPNDVVIVYVPEYVVQHWWERILHNQSALRLKARLLLAPGVMITSVPWQLDEHAEAPATDE